MSIIFGKYYELFLIFLEIAMGNFGGGLLTKRFLFGIIGLFERGNFYDNIKH